MDGTPSIAGGQFEFSYDNYLQTNTGGGLISFNGYWTQDQTAANLSGTPTAPTPGTGSDVGRLHFGLWPGDWLPLGNQTSGAVNISGPVAGKQFLSGFLWRRHLESNQ